VNKEERKLREQTLRATALNCFATEKWEDVSVSRIAKLADVAKGTVYLHFASKDEICACLAQEFYDELQQKYLGITGTGYQQLKQLIKISFRHFHERQQYRHVLQYCQREQFFINLNPDVASALQNARHYHHKRIAIALSRGMQDKTLRPDAGKNLTGICTTLSGALDRFSREQVGHDNINCVNSERTNTEQQSPNGFTDQITDYIISSVENNASPTIDNDTAPPSHELTLEAQ